MEAALLIVLVLLVLVLLAAVLLRRPPRDPAAVALGERLAQLEPLPREIGDVRLGLTTLQADTRARQEAQQQAAESTRQVVDSIRLGLAELQSHVKSGQDLERQTADSMRRLETVMAGTQSKGAAGENILEAVFARLPPAWQARDFRVGNHTVEFALRLPNNLVLPIDSKWAATDLLERFSTSDDPAERQALKKQIESAVAARAREVSKYVDPNVTVNFGVAAVPDAVFELCSGIQADIFRENVVLISYSMFVPYLLLVFQTTLATSRSVDLQKLQAYLQSAESSISKLQGELEGRFSRAITMLGNSRDDMNGHLSTMSSGLASIRISAEAAAPPEIATSAPPEALDPPDSPTGEQ